MNDQKVQSKSAMIIIKSEISDRRQMVSDLTLVLRQVRIFRSPREARTPFPSERVQIFPEWKGLFHFLLLFLKRVWTFRTLKRNYRFFESGILSDGENVKFVSDVFVGNKKFKL